MDPYSFYYDQEYTSYYVKIERFLDRYIDFKGKDVLCLASGTGYIQRRYVDNGARSVTCVDISKDFLDIFRARIAGHPEYRERITLVRQDMAKFEFRRKFDIVLLLGNSFCHLMTQERQIECLERIRKHLRENGRAYLQVVPLSDSMNEDFRLSRSFRDSDGLFVRETAKGRLSYPEHRMDFEVQYRSRRGLIRQVLHTRLMTVPEMQLLLKLTRFKLTTTYFDYARRRKNGANGLIYEVKK